MDRINFFERQIIESGLRVGKSVRSISKSINRDHRTIQKEVDRNKMKGRPYSAKTAQCLAEKRERNRNKPKLQKLGNKGLRQFVVNKLRQDWSPEQIAGVLKKQPPIQLKGKKICLETIYQYVYNGEGRYELLFKHLRRGRNKRLKRWARKPNKISIPERVSIHERPEEINYKKEPGHWESDTLEGKRSTKVNLSVQYERKYQLARINKIENKTAEETENAIRKSIDTLPLVLWKSITFDNGKEGVNHVKIKKDYCINTFFCDPHKAWQKGGVENLNGLLRQYVPKGADISKLTDDYIDSIENKLNNRPRKSLNYLSPNQALEQEVGQ